MSNKIRWCFEHNSEVKKGKRACEYRLIWERDVAGLAECDMADGLVVRTPFDWEAAGWAYWNEERIGSASPNDPPFDDYEKFKGIWIERARMAIRAAIGGKDEGHI